MATDFQLPCRRTDDQTASSAFAARQAPPSLRGKLSFRNHSGYHPDFATPRTLRKYIKGGAANSLPCTMLIITRGRGTAWIKAPGEILELRTSTRLVSLWQSQGKGQEAYALPPSLWPVQVECIERKRCGDGACGIRRRQAVRIEHPVLAHDR
jgi:hypothetical protein